jgi:hypothetical protein
MDSPFANLVDKGSDWLHSLASAAGNKKAVSK